MTRRIMALFSLCLVAALEEKVRPGAMHCITKSLRSVEEGDVNRSSRFEFTWGVPQLSQPPRLNFVQEDVPRLLLCLK